jgi:glyoxalase family protein
MTDLKGLHHVTAITSSAEKIYEFFTFVLGLRLVKKTINQDDINAYHLFFADDRGNPGTDVTFFDFPGSDKGIKGSDEISRIGLRVADDRSIEYWKKRLEIKGVRHDDVMTIFGRKAIFFVDFDGQRYGLFSDEGIQGVAQGMPWFKGPIPNEFAIIGLGPIFINVSNVLLMKDILTTHLKMRIVAESELYTLLEMGEGGNGASVIIEDGSAINSAIQGYGSVHHLAFRIENRRELDAWTTYFNSLRAPNSGFVDRFYFQSLYMRLYRPILFELATEGPGFIDDEEGYEILGETLALPPRFRSVRQQIEKSVRHIDTTRSHHTFEKEY